MTKPDIFSGYQPIENHFGRKDRYDYAAVSYQGQKMFLKTNRLPVGSSEIKRELVWADFMAYVQEHYPAAKILAPGQYQLLDDNNLLMEYIDAPVVAAPRDGLAWRRQIYRYIDTLVTLDEAAEEYVVPASLKTYQPRQVNDALERWLRDVEITPGIQRALEYVGQQKAGLDYRMQHGDLTPWQIFDDGDTWVMFDGERAGDDLPRFNDLAYSYGRLAIRCREQGAADYMVSEFIKRRSVDRSSFWVQFERVLTFRLLGMYGDAVRDEAPAEIAIARSLVEDSLSGEMQRRINVLSGV